MQAALSIYSLSYAVSGRKDEWEEVRRTSAGELCSSMAASACCFDFKLTPGRSYMRSALESGGSATSSSSSPRFLFPNDGVDSCGVILSQICTKYEFVSQPNRLTEQLPRLCTMKVELTFGTRTSRASELMNLFASRNRSGRALAVATLQDASSISCRMVSWSESIRPPSLHLQQSYEPTW